MPDPSLVSYVVLQLNKGFNIDEIKKACLSAGWKEDDIREAIDLALIKQDHTITEKDISLKKSKSSNLYIYILLIIIVSGLIYYFVVYLNAGVWISGLFNKLNKNDINVSVNNSALQNNIQVGSAKYVNDLNGYSFDCLTNWTILGDEISTSIYSPERASEQYGDVIISRIPYTNENHENDAKNFALDAGPNISNTTYAGKKGFMVVSDKNNITVLNYVLIGDNDLITVQFVGAGSFSELSKGQQIIHDSLSFTK